MRTMLVLGVVGLLVGCGDRQVTRSPPDAARVAGAAPARMRSFEELAHVDDPAWPGLQQLIAGATNPVEVLPPAAARAESLVGVQVTLHSTLGAMAYETGGILVDHGWLRLLGSGGHARLSRSIASWNLGRGARAPGGPYAFTLVADDVMGGFFAIDGGGWGAPGHVFYFAPDVLRWVDFHMGYSEFVWWCLNADLGKFYRPYRWPGWEAEVALLTGDQAYSIYPPPFTEEGGLPYGGRSRRPEPVESAWSMDMIFAAQVGDLPNGTKIEIRVVK